MVASVQLPVHEVRVVVSVNLIQILHFGTRKLHGQHLLYYRTNLNNCLMHGTWIIDNLSPQTNIILLAILLTNNKILKVGLTDNERTKTAANNYFHRSKQLMKAKPNSTNKLFNSNKSISVLFCDLSFCQFNINKNSFYLLILAVIKCVRNAGWIIYFHLQKVLNMKDSFSNWS